MVLQKGIIFGISFGVAAAVFGASLAVINSTDTRHTIYSLAGFLTWFVVFFVLRYRNIAELHGKERQLLIDHGTKLAKDRLCKRLGIESSADDDPTKSPITEEARKCLDYYL
jgi:hypothetical protein